MSTSVVLIISLGVALCAAAVVILVRVSRAESTRADERRAVRRRDKNLDEFYTAPLQPIAYVDVVVKKDEVFYFSDIAEWEAHREGFGQRDTPRMSGMLYLSNQRFIFIGSGIDERMAFDSWQRATVHANAIQLHFRKNTIVVYGDNPRLGPIFERIEKKQFDALHPKGD
jgi:hypothetical protein